MSEAQTFDILVAGGGMIGSALALGLSRQGWHVGLVEGSGHESLVEAPDSATTVADFEPRVSAISVASQQLLEQLGVWSEVTAGRHCPYQTMTVWDGDGTGRIQFEAVDVQEDTSGQIL